MNNLTRSLAEAEDFATQSECNRQEQESRLKVAQQHLAKKLREATILSGKNEEMHHQVINLEKELGQAKTKQLELQTTLETNIATQKRLQEQYQDTIKSFESQSSKWEEKYFQMHQKWQDAEGRNRELKKLEERFIKLQNVIGSLSPLLSHSISVPVHEASSQGTFTTKEKAESHILPPPCATIQPSIFDSSTAPSRFKDTLFG